MQLVIKYQLKVVEKKYKYRIEFLTQRFKFLLQVSIGSKYWFSVSFMSNNRYLYEKATRCCSLC